MRNLFIIGMLLVGAFMAGWFKVNREGDQTTISINRAEIRQDTRKAIDRGREILDRQQERLAADSQSPYGDQPQYGEQPQYDQRFDDRMAYPPAPRYDEVRTADRSNYPSAPPQYQDNYRQTAPQPNWDVNQTYGRPSQTAPTYDNRRAEDLRYQSR